MGAVQWEKLMVPSFWRPGLAIQGLVEESFFIISMVMALSTSPSQLATMGVQSLI